MNLWTKPIVILACLFPLTLRGTTPLIEIVQSEGAVTGIPKEIPPISPAGFRPWVPNPGLSYNPDLIETGNAQDLSLVGPGYFVVRNPESGDLLLVRSGDFRIDSDGRWVTGSGEVLQAWLPDNQGLSDLVSSSGHFGNRFIRIHGDGRIDEWQEDGSQKFRGTLAIWRPASEPLQQLESNRFWDPSLAGAAASRHASGFQRLETEVVMGWWEATPASLAIRPPAPSRIATRPAHRSPVGLTEALLLEGPGFWSVRDPLTGRKYLTRRAIFRVDTTRYLVTAEKGFRLQRRDAEGRVGDFQLPPRYEFGNADRAPAWVYYRVDLLGRVYFRLIDGADVSGGTLEIIRILDPARLVSAGKGFWVNDESLPRHPAPFSSDLPLGEKIRVSSGWMDPRALDPSEEAVIQTRYRHSQHAVEATGRPWDFAIWGEGYFLVRRPGTVEPELTRVGRFALSADGFLETSYGERVQGVIPGQDRLSDIPIGPLAASSGDSASLPLSVDANGVIIAHSENGSMQQVAALAFGFADNLGQLKETRPFGYTYLGANGHPIEPPWRGAEVDSWGPRVQRGSVELVEAPPPLPMIPDWATQIEVLGTTARPLEIAVSDDGVQWRPWLSRGPEGAWTIAPGAESTTVRVSEWYPVFFDVTQPQAGSRLYRLTPQPWQY